MSLTRSLAVALAGCACLASSAGATQTVKLKVAFTPSRVGARTTIDLALRISGPGSMPPEPVTSLDLRLPAGMGLAGSTLGEDNCSTAELFNSGLAGCPSNALIGLGTATATVPVGSQIVTEKASLYALIGEPGENRIEVLFYIQVAEPVAAQLVLPSVVQEATPPYGEQLATAVPLVEAWPEGPDLVLQTFDSTLGPQGLIYHRELHGRTVSYKPRGIRIPPICPTGGYPFEAILTFQDGSSSTASYRVPCSQ
jgi:hypothetical protein